jgi:hypothetical protein
MYRRSRLENVSNFIYKKSSLSVTVSLVPPLQIVYLWYPRLAWYYKIVDKKILLKLGGRLFC